MLRLRARVSAEAARREALLVRVARLQGCVRVVVRVKPAPAQAAAAAARRAVAGSDARALAVAAHAAQALGRGADEEAHALATAAAVAVADADADADAEAEAESGAGAGASVAAVALERLEASVIALASEDEAPAWAPAAAAAGGGSVGAGALTARRALLLGALRDDDGDAVAVRVAGGGGRVAVRRAFLDAGGDGPGADAEFFVDAAFDGGEAAAQQLLEAARPLVEAVARAGVREGAGAGAGAGASACVIACGATGSGKSFTMGGATFAGAVSAPAGAGEEGLVPRALRLLFERVAVESTSGAAEGGASGAGAGAGAGTAAAIVISAFEIRGESVFELLVNDADASAGGGSGVAAPPLTLRERADGSAEIVGLRSLRFAADVRGLAGAEAAYRAAASRRSEGAHALSSRAHRGHFFVRAGVAAGRDEPASVLQLVELGGSERVERSRATGAAAREAAAANVGLAALERCLDALRRRAAHVPFRASRLSHALKGALTVSNPGNPPPLLLLVACVSASARDAHESAATLAFAEACRAVQLVVPAPAPGVAPRHSPPPPPAATPASATTMAARAGQRRASGGRSGSGALAAARRVSFGE